MAQLQERARNTNTKLSQHAYLKFSNLRLTFITWFYTVRFSDGIKCNILVKYNHKIVGRNSSVGIASHYGLDGPGIESLQGARLSAPVQTCPGAYPASYAMGTGSLSRGQSGRGGTLTTHLHLAPRSKKEQSYTSTPPLGHHGLFQYELYLLRFYDHNIATPTCFSIPVPYSGRVRSQYHP